MTVITHARKRSRLAKMIDSAGGVSIGVALSSTGYKEAEDIIRDADTAMYRAKDRGKARYEIFDTAMHTRAVTLLRLESDLRRAIEKRSCAFTTSRSSRSRAATCTASKRSCAGNILNAGSSHPTTLFHSLKRPG